jgi:hypothetical protein
MHRFHMKRLIKYMHYLYALSFTVFCLISITVQISYSQAVKKVEKIEKVCSGGGSVRFGVPWPKSTKPLQSISTSFDGRPNDDVVLNGNVQLFNIASPTMATTQSSTESGGDASRAVDGDISNNAGTSELGASCTQTQSESKPWWRVDLGTSQFVHTVRVYNRGDSNAAALDDLEVYVNDVSPLEISSSVAFLAFSAASKCGSGVSIPNGKYKDIV